MPLILKNCQTFVVWQKTKPQIEHLMVLLFQCKPFLIIIHKIISYIPDFEVNPLLCALLGEAHDKDVQVVELPIVDSLHPRPPYLPLAIPEDLAPRLQRLHGDPSVWWVSQFVKYLVRPQAWLEKEIQQTTAKLGFKHPIIG